MRVLLLILVLSAQDLDWKPIKEMSGTLTDYPGLTVRTSGAEIARGGDMVKITLKMEFPEGSPGDMLRDSVPRGVDPTSIARIEGRVELNCESLVVKPVKSSAIVYQFNGKSFKSKEPPFKVASGSLLAFYFCERGERPTKAPTLKPK